MTKPFGKTFILSGVAISALVLLIISMQTKHGLSERRSSASSSSNGLGDDYDSTDSSDESAMRSTKVNRIRPGAEELAKKRSARALERRRIELVRKLQMMRDGGLSDRNPSMKATLEELAKDPEIRTELQNDRTHVLWTRDPAENGLQLTQYQFAVGGAVSLKTVHRLDPNGSALGSKIFDEQDNEIFKVSYGYRKSDGIMVEERVFDSQDRLLDNQDIEIPIRRIFYSINADDGSLESKVVDIAASSFPPQMNTGFKNPFLQQ